MARLLIVDDEESDLFLMKSILESAGHSVLLSDGADNALARFRDEPVEIVVTDLQMEGGHGFELILALRRLAAPPLVLAVSGTGDDQLQIAEALGAAVVLQKPIDPERLTAAVRVLSAGE